MDNKPILIVDDEKNIRMTLAHSLKPLEAEVDTAVNAEEGLSKLEEKDYGVILLDLRLPGMHGMEMLRRVAELRPDVHVIIITAYGTVESAVEAMKLGAVDYLQKPFSPQEIRDIVSRVLDRDGITEEQAQDYDSRVELAKKLIGERKFDAATEHMRQAVALDSSRPEAFNLLGALLEMKDDVAGAQQNYRAALAADPSYKPARDNLHRVSGWEPEQEMVLERQPDEDKQTTEEE
ncbi:MAG: response regulator [Candidatus Brocadiia bacterium]